MKANPVALPPSFLFCFYLFLVSRRIKIIQACSQKTLFLFVQYICSLILQYSFWFSVFLPTRCHLFANQEKPLLFKICIPFWARIIGPMFTWWGNLRMRKLLLTGESWNILGDYCDRILNGSFYVLVDNHLICF